MPVYNGPSVVIRPSICALVMVCFFSKYTLKRLSSFLCSKAETISGKNNSNFVCMQRKLSGRISQNLHLVQQKVQQIIHNIHDVVFIRHIWFQLNSGTSPLKYNIPFWLLYCNFKFFVQYVVRFAVQL